MMDALPSFEIAEIHDETLTDPECNHCIDDSTTTDSLDAAAQHRDYIKFCQSLTMPIDPESVDNENDSDSEFCLHDELLAIDTDNIHRHNSRFNATTFFPSRPTTVDLSQDQIDKIKCLMSVHFQMLVQLRHLTIDKLEYREQHQICDDLLQDLRKKKLNAEQSIRTTLLHQMPYRRDGFNHAITRNLHQQRIEDLKRHSMVGSAFDIHGMEQYLQFNRARNKSLLENLRHFKAEGITLNESLKPKFMVIPTTKRKNKKWSAPHFSSFEMELLGMAMREYGHSIAPKGDSGLIAPDWKSIQSRYFPHKTIRFLQCKVGRLRSSRSKRRKKGNVGIGMGVDPRSDTFGRTRSKPRRMTAEERQTLLKGIEIFGLKNWAGISKELLPNWTRLELRKQYFRKIKPSLEQDRRLEVITKSHCNNQAEDTENHGDNIEEMEMDVSSDGNSTRLPVLSHVEQVEILNDEYRLQKLKQQIRSVIERRRELAESAGKGPINFFNPAADHDCKMTH